MVTNKEIISQLLQTDLSEYDNQAALLSMAREVEEEDKGLAKKLGNKVRFLAQKGSLTGDIRFLNLYNNALLYLAQSHKDFDAYMLYVEKNRDPEEKYYLPRRNKLFWIVQKMQNLIDDKLDILAISMPPGSG